MSAHPARSPIPRTRTRDVPGLVLPLLAAAVLGLATGISPQWTLLVVGGLGALTVLLLRVELAALAVIGASVFEDYLVDLTPWVTKGLALVLVASWVVRRLRQPLFDGPRSRVTDAVVVFLLVLLVATLVHPNGRAGLDVLLRYVGFIAVTLVLIEVLRGPLRPRRAAMAYVVACTAAAVAGILTYLSVLSSDAGDKRVVGPIGDPNDLAFFLLAAVPLALVLRRGVRSTWLLDLALATMLVAIAGTLSRGALVGLAAMLVYVLVTRQFSFQAVMGVVALLLIGIGIVSIAFPEQVRSSLDQKAFVADQNVSERLDLWQAASTMTLENPVLGLGPGAFSLRHREFRQQLPDDVSATLDVAHNTWLEASAELGLIGAVSLLAIFLLGFGASWQRWRRDRDPLAAGVCAALVGTVVAATFVTEQYFLPMWLLAALGAALNLRVDESPAPTPPRRRRPDPEPEQLPERLPDHGLAWS